MHSPFVSTCNQVTSITAIHCISIDGWNRLKSFIFCKSCNFFPFSILFCFFFRKIVLFKFPLVIFYLIFKTNSIYDVFSIWLLKFSNWKHIRVLKLIWFTRIDMISKHLLLGGFCSFRWVPRNLMVFFISDRTQKYSEQISMLKIDTSNFITVMTHTVQHVRYMKKTKTHTESGGGRLTSAK